jgi:hypothetical protein
MCSGHFLLTQELLTPRVADWSPPEFWEWSSGVGQDIQKLAYFIDNFPYSWLLCVLILYKDNFPNSLLLCDPILVKSKWYQPTFPYKTVFRENNWVCTTPVVTVSVKILVAFVHLCLNINWVSDGSAYTLGRINRDCWYLYTLEDEGISHPDQTFEVSRPLIRKQSFRTDLQ